jgi:glucan biosynthesis protein C
LLTNGEFARHHSLDAFRAAMMLLGLVLHSAASYTYTPLREAWPFHDPPGLVAFEILLLFIHVFRMPAFFVVAGFFAALLYYRDGARGLIRNRTRRVALPLLIFMLTALPLAGAGFLVASRLEGQPLPPEVWPQGPLLHQQIFGHLWFLYDLLVFYAASLVVVRAVAMLPARARASASAAFHRYAVTAMGALVLGLLTTVTLMPMAGPGLETSASLLPPLRILVAYGVFFAFGWCLYRHRDDLIPAFGRIWGRFLAAGLVLFVGYFMIMLAKPRLSPLAWHFTAIGFAGPATWFLIFGLLGLFVRRLSSPRPVVRYLSDASYWMYLTHLTAITWTAAALARSTAPAVVKFTIVLSVTTAVTLVTYHWWVRFTWLGVLLNGRRYERASEQVTAPG